jgi:hypothetical protein
VCHISTLAYTESTFVAFCSFFWGSLTVCDRGRQQKGGGGGGVDNRKALELINGIISLVQAYFPFGPTFHLGPPLA